MKINATITAIGFSFLTFFAEGQGTFVYDQQSSDENNFMEGGEFVLLNQPIGQSFTPGLSSVEFVRLYLYDATFGNAVNGTLFVQLRTDSINGPVLSSTSPVVLPPAYGGTVNFFFSTPVAVTSGDTYYLQLALQSGNSWGVNAAQYNYSAGSSFNNNTPNQAKDLWFREGIVVPEPTAKTLAVIGGAALLATYRKRKTLP